MTARVLVRVSDGMTEVYIAGDVEVLTVDYDIDGLTEGDLVYDLHGEPCAISWGVTPHATLVEDTFEHFDLAG